MKVRNTLLAALVIEVLAVAALLAPGTGPLVHVGAGIASSLAIGLAFLALLAWRMYGVAIAEFQAHAGVTDGAALQGAVTPLSDALPASNAPITSPAALAG